MIFQGKNILLKHILFFLCFIHLSCLAPVSDSFFYLEGKPQLVNKINQIINAAGIDLNMGIKIVSLNHGKTLYAYNSQKLLMPASTNKLYTCAAALHYLGNDYSFKTSILKNKNNLVLKGGGDPDLTIDHLDSIAQLVSEIIKDVDTLYLNDRQLDSLNYGEGWMWDEGPWWYASPISALSVNDNCIDFYVEPGKIGNPAKIEYYPNTDYIRVLANRSRSVNDTLNFEKFTISRNWIDRNNDFTINGEIMDTTKRDTLYRNINNPTLFTGTVFKELLKKYKTDVKNISSKMTSISNYTTIVSHTSDSLIISAKNLLNESDNLTAELFVKTIGSLDTIPGTWETGIDSIKSFLASEVEIDTSRLRIADGSGVSRYTLTSSDQLISLLKYMYDSPYREDFIYCLPGGGSPKSTLENRLINENNMVKAKTGGLSGVRNLAGYIFSPKHGPLAFSILMNGYIGSDSKYRSVQDQIIKTMIYD